MKIVDIKNVFRKDIPIYYRRLYTAVAVIEFVNKPEEIPLDFMIEHMPTGHVEITLFLPEKLDYPLVPLQKELRSFISVMDGEGKLPT